MHRSHTRVSTTLLDSDPDAPRGAGDWKRGLGLVLAAFVATRLVVWTAAYTGALINFRLQLGLIPPFEAHVRALAPAVADPTSPVGAEFRERLLDLAPLNNADGRHYASILHNGYRYTPRRPTDHPADRQQNIAFFPLYPLVCYPLSLLIGVRPAMIVVAHLAGAAAAGLLYLWARRRAGETGGRLAAIFLLCLPTACYFSFGYAESLTLLLVTAALLAMDLGHFVGAALLCGLATACRPTALPIVPVLLVAWWFNGPRAIRSRLGGLIPLGTLACAGIGGYALYLTVRFGSPLVYVDNFRVGWVTDSMRADWFQYLTLARVWDQFKYFGRVLRDFPWGLSNLADPFAWNMPLTLSMAALSLLAIPRVPRSFQPFLLLAPLIFLQSYLASGGATFGVEPIARYMAVSAPVFVVLGGWARHWPEGVRTTLLVAMMLLQAAWAFRFGMDEWAG